MLSLSKGVPILASGISEGKNDVNAHVRHFKVGIDLRTEKPMPDKIRIKAEEILAAKKFKNNALKLKSILNNYNANKIIEDIAINGKK
jgi:UDP:flavonoid glycosyltransferase YjiC (YdhE family)